MVTLQTMMIFCFLCGRIVECLILVTLKMIIINPIWTTTPIKVAGRLRNGLQKLLEDVFLLLKKYVQESFLCVMVLDGLMLMCGYLVQTLSMLDRLLTLLVTMFKLVLLFRVVTNLEKICVHLMDGLGHI